MKKILLFLFNFLHCFSSFAQPNWLCVYPNKKVYFEDKNKLVYCIRIDSTFNDNTILYPFSDLHKIDIDCYSVTSGSWLSKYIVLDEDENTIFVNGKKQQIFIKNQAVLNDIWNVFENDNIKVKGKITSISTESVLGVEDSVKTFSFSVYNKNDEPVNHELNQLTIKISKQFGLVKTLNFYYFEHEILDYWHHFGEFDLIGIDEPQLGFKPSNLKENYYDFQVGDELHIWNLYSPFIPPSYEKKIIHKYLSREDSEDSITYYIERKVHNHTVDGIGHHNISTSMDTIILIAVKGLLFYTEPNELLNGAISKVMILNLPLQKMYIDSYDFWITGDSCLGIVNVDVCNSPPTYFLGLGGPYYEHCEIWGNEYAYELVYYKKGNTTWGTPFDFEVSVSEHVKETSIIIYPNPTRNFITIKSTNNEILNNCFIDIYDIQGRKCLSQNIVNCEHIDVAFLNAGFYVVKLTQKNKNIVYIKMIKQ